MPTYLRTPINPLTRKSGRTKLRRVYQLHSSRSNRKRKLSDPFDGQYQCDPFADITQGATKQEVEDDMTAICAGITAVDARQPTPIYVVGTRWVEQVEKEKVERKMKKEEKPKANVVVAASTDAGKGPITRAMARKKEETPIQTSSSTRTTEKVDADGPSPKTSQKSMAGAEAPMLGPPKPKTATRSAPQSYNEDSYDANQTENEEEPEATPTPGPHRVPKRKAQTPPAFKPATTADGNGGIWESVRLTQPNSEPAKKLKPGKSTFELNAENAKRLVQKRLSDYFGPRGRKGARRSSLEVTSFLGC